MAWAFTALAISVFIVRGPLRALSSGDDFVPQYAGARAWLQGLNPYEKSSLAGVLLSAGRETDEQGRPIFNWSLYPPGTFVAVAPFAVLSWPAARIAFLVITLALFIWHLRALLRMAELAWTEAAGVWLAGGVIALAPYHTGIALAQQAIPSVALVVLATDRIHRGHAGSGGALLALATLLKPQIAAPFILYFMLRRHQRAALIALALCGIATVIGIAWLAVNDVPWFESWRGETKEILQPGGHHDPAGPWSAQLLELRPLITALTGIRSSGAIGFAIASALGVAVYVMGRRLPREEDLLLLSAVAVLMLFATYHRFYDAAILCLPLAWAATTFRREPSPRRQRRLAIAAIACCAVFFAPGAWMLQRFANEGRIPPPVTDTWLWNAVLLRHQNWALVALCVTLILAVNRLRQRTGEYVP